jgi:hypothetical protein
MNITRLPAVVQKNATIAHVGAASVSYYDPYMPRTIETIKSALSKGHPLLVRLHSAAEYPVDAASELPRDQIDLEGHAVLIVGYNDETQEFAFADPWTEGKHDPSSIRWLPYSFLHVAAVDCSMGVVLMAAPPAITWAVSRDAEDRPQLALTVGFENVPGRVMDRENIHFSAVHANFETAEGEYVEHELEGKWHVGETAELSFPLQPGWPDTTLSVGVTVSGARPYPFSDVLTAKFVVHADEQRVQLPAKRAA